MLPTGSFAEVVGFLRLFYLSSLAATNALCSSLAVKASAEIRREELSGLHFKMWNNLIGISRGETQIVARLAFPSETATTEFIDAAFPKCILDDVVLSSSVNKRLLDAIGRVAGSVVVQRVLSLSGNISLNGSLGIARKFRKVKVSFFTRFAHVVT
ncbi:hypothetical protein AAVH_16315 [Aphelenchoides avenae]|nr:hypothetical protein AAVH_16315 [Aphelenchus avenae]